MNSLIDEVKKNGGIKYAEEKMDFFRDEALTLLYDFPESETRTALENLVRYVTEGAN